jgi:hypothetical protein
MTSTPQDTGKGHPMNRIITTIASGITISILSITTLGILNRTSEPIPWTDTPTTHSYPTPPPTFDNQLNPARLTLAQHGIPILYPN